MSSLHKRMQKATFEEQPRTRKGAKYATGRWTEKEHYLFLLAVRDHGRDWKKIEEYVKSRSSTQARSHAQKVLKDDVVDYLDDEIDKLAEIYDKPLVQEKKVDSLSSTKTHSQGSVKGAKGKRKSKRNRKAKIEKEDINKLLEISKENSILSEKENQSVSIDEEDSIYSEYSYPEESNTKLFSIEKIVKKRNKPGRKRAKVNNTPSVIVTKETLESRKDSVATTSSGSSATAASPANTTTTVVLTPKPKRQKLSNQIALQPQIEENAVVAKHKNGCSDELDQKEVEVDNSETSLKICLKRGVSLQTQDQVRLVENEPEIKTCKTSSARIKSFLIPS